MTFGQEWPQEIYSRFGGRLEVAAGNLRVGGGEPRFLEAPDSLAHAPMLLIGGELSRQLLREMVLCGSTPTIYLLGVEDEQRNKAPISIPRLSLVFSLSCFLRSVFSALFLDWVSVSPPASSKCFPNSLTLVI